MARYFPATRPGASRRSVIRSSRSGTCGSSRSPTSSDRACDRAGVAPRRAADVRGLLEQALLRHLPRVDLRARGGPVRTAAALLRVQGAHGGRPHSVRAAGERERPRGDRYPRALDDRDRPAAVDGPVRRVVVVGGLLRGARAEAAAAGPRRHAGRIEQDPDHRRRRSDHAIDAALQESETTFWRDVRETAVVSGIAPQLERFGRVGPRLDCPYGRLLKVVSPPRPPGVAAGRAVRGPEKSWQIDRLM